MCLWVPGEDKRKYVEDRRRQMGYGEN